MKVSDVIRIAKGEVGYIEKASNYDLDSKTGNPGYANYTKYARDLYKAGYYGGVSKQGCYYCDIFADWVYFKACGENRTLAEKATCQEGTIYGAGCTQSASYYKSHGRYGTTPKAGAQIFFGDFDHTGIVIEATKATITTVEGNTTQVGNSGNGGGVFMKCYSRNDSWIKGFGYPYYEDESTITTPTAAPSSSSATVISPKNIKEVQSFLCADGFKIAVDGVYGNETKSALVKDLQRTIGLFGADVDGICGSKTATAYGICQKGNNGKKAKLTQCALICRGHSVGSDGADGDFGVNTYSAVMRFQKANNLLVDGIVGANTILKLLG